MKRDAREITTNSKIECDVLIVGGGAAGISAACELINSGLTVVLLESGGNTMDAETQKLAGGEVDNPATHGPLGQYRKRVFGGTTTVWGGRCAPFDAIDFEKRDHVPHSGWPITKSELDPYYRRAHMYTDTGNYDYECATSLADGELKTIPGLKDDVWLQDTIWRFSLPTNFATKSGKRLVAASNVTVIFKANALKILTDESGSSVTGVEASSLDGNRFEIATKTVILAAGGLESTRLLMVSNEIKKFGLGNDHDVLGRYYLSHISGDLGEIRFTPKNLPVVWQYQRAVDSVYVKRNFRIREEVQKSEHLLNFRFNLTHPPFGDPDHGSSVLSAAYLVKRFFRGKIPPEYSKELASLLYLNVPQHVRNVIFGVPSLVGFAFHWLFQRILANRKYPSVSLRSRSNTYTIHFDAEQAPNPESRVVLSNHKDCFGFPLLRTEWRSSSQDLDSIVRYHDLLREEVEESGVGELSLRKERVMEVVSKGFGVGSHHIGTTRMSDDPNFGVVDRNCEVHGVSGLFVAAPSVFPTASFANPVLTITAMAIRVADYVKSRASS
jgi:choline dehydrogenase-like flavoprotein